MDNLGGYKKIEMIFADSQTKKIELPFQQLSAKIQSVPSRTDAGVVYENSAQIFIPEQYLTAKLTAAIKRAAVSYMLLQYVTALDNAYQMGSEQYPLLMTYEEVAPGAAASIAGMWLNFTGKSTASPQKLQI